MEREQNAGAGDEGADDVGVSGPAPRGRIQAAVYREWSHLRVAYARVHGRPVLPTSAAESNLAMSHRGAHVSRICALIVVVVVFFVNK